MKDEEINMNNDGMKDFAQWVEQFVMTRKPHITEHEGRHYLLKSEGMNEIAEPMMKCIGMTTLTGMVDFIEGRPRLFDGMNNPAILHIISPTEIELYDEAYGPFIQKHTYARSCALVPKISFDTFLSQEQFVIQAQSCFVHGENDDLENVLSVSGNVREEAIKDTLDDGVSQVATVKSGVSVVKDIVLPKQVKLTPRRTFVEIDQPSSGFVYRVADGPKIAIFEADGGAWRNEATQRIFTWFTDNLAQRGILNRVTIIA